MSQQTAGSDRPPAGARGCPRRWRGGGTAAALANEMDLQISWETLGKLTLAGVGTYVLAPALLVLRDIVLWKVIRRFVLNDKLYRQIQMRANDVWYLNNRYNYSRSIEDSTSGTKYFLNDTEVSEMEFQKISDAISFHGKRADRAAAEIRWKSNLLNWLLRHYSQENSANPIPNWESEALERVERREQRASANKTLEPTR
jgi:hypothetical protein